MCQEALRIRGGMSDAPVMRQEDADTVRPRVRVRQLMQAEVLEAERDELLSEAAIRMRDHQVGSLMVLSGDELVGILSERDIVRPVEVAPPTVRPGRCEISVAWKAAEGSRLFPELGGVFELLAAGPARSTISFEASYDPPVRAIGRLVDHALLHRVAEACVQDFVARIAKELASQAE